MAAPTTLPALMDDIQTSISAALDITPKLKSTIAPPSHGNSLLDVKNELMLAYLQNLVFLILIKLRQSRNSTVGDKVVGGAIRERVVMQLTELRLYLDKGVRPVVDKLRYQIEKTLRQAEDAERNARSAEARKLQRDRAKAENSSDLESESEPEEDDETGPAPPLDQRAVDLLSRPRIAAFVRPDASKNTDAADDEEDGAVKSGVYRPPRLNPVVMPTTTRQERAERRPVKSATLDEFIADEMSSFPLAQPSIGTTIAEGGRKMKTAAERKREDERREYEEQNFIRLPKESKKDRAKRGETEGRSGRMNFGGEEWRDLGEGVDRINRLTQATGHRGGTRALLEKSRKRARDTLDGPRGSGNSEGVQIGQQFQKRLKTMDKQRKGKKKK